MSNNCPICNIKNYLCEDEFHLFSIGDRAWFLRFKKDLIQVGFTGNYYYVMFFTYNHGFAVGKPLKIEKFSISESVDIILKFNKLRLFL